MMLEQPGEVLTRDELRDRLWPDGTFVDFEHGLNAAVKRLRAVLGDNAERPRFVETLHRARLPLHRRVERVDGDERRSQLADTGPAPQAAARRPAVQPPGRDERPGIVHRGPDRGADDAAGPPVRRPPRRHRALVVSQRPARGSHRSRDRRGAARDYLVEGNVRREGDRVRITAQLIEVRGETQLWADSYERPPSDNLLVQSDVATADRAFAGDGAAARSRADAAAGTRHVDAYQNYLKGRYHWNRPGDEGHPRMPGLLRQAVKLDRQFGTRTPRWRAPRSPRSTTTCANRARRLTPPRPSAARALALDPTDSEAHVALAEVRRCRDWDWDGAEEAYRRALSFNPSNEAARRLYGLLLGARGRHEDAVAMTDRALELDPLCLTAGTSAAWVRYVAGDYDEVIERCRHTIDMDRPTSRLTGCSPRRFFRAGDRERLHSAFGLAAGGADGSRCRSHGWRTRLGVKGDRDRAVNILCQLDELAQERYVSSYHRALAHAGLGDLDAHVHAARARVRGSRPVAHAPCQWNRDSTHSGRTPLHRPHRPARARRPWRPRLMRNRNAGRSPILVDDRGRYQR